MELYPDPGFVPLLCAAVADGDVQGVLHDWLAEQGFPHAEELRTKGYQVFGGT